MSLDVTSGNGKRIRSKGISARNVDIISGFNNHNARVVFILNEEKFIPFKIFAKNFLALTKDDGKIYDFILFYFRGTNRYGNSWAECMAQLAQRRNKRKDRCITSIDSGKLFYNIQMIIYNLFRERKFKIDDEKVWMTPFQLAGAKYTDAQEAWDILKDFL